MSKAQDNNPYEAFPVTDVDGNVYKVIMLEEGVWMAENLRTTSFNDGSPIPLNKDNNSWKELKTSAYGWYNDDINYRNTYGAIYNWHAVGTGKLCPVGWHVPTEQEWIALMDYAGGLNKSGDNPGKLKEKGTAHWKSPNTGATNEIYFNALPAGGYSFFPWEIEPGTKTDWWTSTEDTLDMEPDSKMPSANAAIVGLSNDFHSRTSGTYQKEAALPVRCKKDE